MARKTPPCEVYPAWTEARFWAFVRSALRQAWTRWPPKYETLERVGRPYKGTDKRQKKEFQCAICNEWHKRKEVEVDHIEPAGRLRTYEDLPRFVARLFVGADKLRTLCKPCHQKVTIAQRATTGDEDETMP